MANREHPFHYTIVGAGNSFEAGSMDTGMVTVIVNAPVMGDARVQFKDDSNQVFEAELWFIGQDNIDNNVFTANLSMAGEVSECFDVPAGLNVSVQARLAVNEITFVDGFCPSLGADMDYTIRVQPDAGGNLEIVCEEGLFLPVLCP